MKYEKTTRAMAKQYDDVYEINNRLCLDASAINELGLNEETKELFISSLLSYYEKNADISYVDFHFFDFTQNKGTDEEIKFYVYIQTDIANVYDDYSRKYRCASLSAVRALGYDLNAIENNKEPTEEYKIGEITEQRKEIRDEYVKKDLIVTLDEYGVKLDFNRFDAILIKTDNEDITYCADESGREIIKSKGESELSAAAVDIRDVEHELTEYIGISMKDMDFAVYVKSADAFIKIDAMDCLTRISRNKIMTLSEEEKVALASSTESIADLNVLINDSNSHVREAVARRGIDECLDILVNDEEPNVRRVVAEQGRVQDLDILVYDEDISVRCTVAMNGNVNHLDILKEDGEKEVIEASGRADKKRNSVKERE